MVLRHTFPFPSPAQGVRESDPGQSVPPEDEGLADTDRNPRRRVARRPALWPHSSRVTLLFGAFLTITATAGIIGSVILGIALMSQVERTMEANDGAEHMRSLNESCRSELAVTKGELRRMDRLLQYAGQGR